MDLPNKKFCVLPWVSLEASPIGTVRPCCLADGEIEDSTGRKYDLNHDNLKEIQNSQYMVDLRKEFLAGNTPDLCRRCWAEEDSGRTSKRMHTLDRLKAILADEKEWTESAKPLRFVDLKLGNICNIACRICGSWSSSTYAAEELREMPRALKRQSFAHTMNQKGAWPKNSLVFWDSLSDNSQDIKYLEFTGGEPFMIKPHFEYLNRLVDNGDAADVEIHYNTNGTLFPVESEVWKHFKHVEVAFSIDDVGDRFEYQRYGASWKTVNENIQKFKQLREQLQGRLSLQVCSTVNIFNIFYLEELAQWIDQQGFDFVYWNMLHDAPQHCITSLPAAAKKAAAARLQSAQVRSFHKKEFENIVLFMMSADTHNETFYQDIEKLDKRRQQSIKEYLPELANAIYETT